MNRLCAAAAFISTAANADEMPVSLGSSQHVIVISGSVPTICRVDTTVDIIAAKPGAVSLGMMKEFCNSATGYHVLAECSPSLGAASLIVDGRPVRLKAGASEISRSNRAGTAERELLLKLPAGIPSGSISIRIEPL